MLTLNPTSLRNTLGDAAGGPTAAGGATTNPNTDPAGFASLLRQNRIATSAMPAPTPMPTMSTPAPAPAAAPAPSSEARPNGDDAPRESTEQSQTDGTEAPQESDPANRARALLRGKLRAADHAAPASTKGDARAASGKTETAADATADQRNDATAPNGTTGTAGAAIDPNVMQWLAGLQRGPAVPGETRGQKAGAEGQPGADADADGTATATATANGTASATDEAHGSAKGPRTAVDLKAEADLKDKAASANEAPADASAGRFAAMLVDQREIERPALPLVSVVGGAKDAAAAASALAFTPPPTGNADASAPTAVMIATPVSAPDFAQELGLSLSLLAKDGVQTAELHLNPADMGPVSVQIVMDGTQARVDFGADMAATRHAIEAGLPELASALADAGFTLAGGGVSQHAGGRGEGGGSSPSPDDGAGGRRTAVPDPIKHVASAARRIVTQGGVDLFA